jgi:metabolite-proton symporter
LEREVEKLAGANIGGETRIGTVATASFIGTAIEAYDLYLYGFAAAFVLGPLFFPGFSETAQTLAAFATFAASFLARPLGAILFGHFGDRLGRKAMLVLSLLVMGFATFFIGLLPGFDTLGVAAPLLLVVLRFLQGVGFGGEWGGAVLMSAEDAPRGRRGFYASFPQLGPPVGFLFASGAFLVVTTTFSDAGFQTFGWRIPFLVSIVLVGIGLYVRIRIAETPVFRRAMEEQSASRVPILELVRRYPKELILTTGTMVVLFGTFYIFSTFAPSYETTQLGLGTSTTLYITMTAVIFMGLTIPVSAAVSDRVGRRNLCLAAAALFGLWAFPMFWLVDTGEPLLIILSFAVLMVIYGMMFGPVAAFFSEQFETRVRYSGISLGYNLGGIVGGAFTPIIATELFASTGASWSISLYIVALAAISLLSVFLLSETYSKDLSDVEAGSRGPAKSDPATDSPGSV